MAYFEDDREDERCVFYSIPPRKGEFAINSRNLTMNERMERLMSTYLNNALIELNDRPHFFNTLNP